MTIILAHKDNLSFCHLGSLSLDKRSKPNFPFGYHINSPNLCLLTFFNIYIQGCLVPVLCSFINRWWRQNVVKAKEGKTNPGRVLMFRHLGLDFTPFLVVNWNNPAYKFSKPLAMLEKHVKQVSRDVSVLYIHLPGIFTSSVKNISNPFLLGSKFSFEWNVNTR